MLTKHEDDIKPTYMLEARNKFNIFFNILSKGQKKLNSVVINTLRKTNDSRNTEQRTNFSSMSSSKRVATQQNSTI